MNNSVVPYEATHVWTPAVDKPWVRGYVFRRAYYMLRYGVWCSYTFNKQWAVSLNEDEWFSEEEKNGYLVTIQEFNSEGFVSKPEVV